MSTPVLLGLPYDGSSSFLRGPAEAPAAVRRVLHRGSGNWSTERGVDLDPASGTWCDLGDADIPDDPPGALVAVRGAARALDAPAVSLGGDHFVTYPLVEVLAERHPELTILHVDAHPDLYDELDGERLSHACPFARILEGGHAARLVQFGIRTLTPHQRDQADRFGVEIHTAAGWDGSLPEVAGDVYVSIDVDGLDPAFAPGVSHHEPGGLTSRQVVDLVHQLADAPGARLVGADVVEINPRRDHHDMTTTLGAKLVKELLGVLVEQR
ncbi:MAG: agmatinase family protein [Actinomycetota bacterium]